MEKKNRNEGIIKSNQLPDSVQRVLPEIAVGTHPQGQGESREAKGREDGTASANVAAQSHLWYNH